jgi:hypothetical protein
MKLITLCILLSILCTFASAQDLQIDKDDALRIMHSHLKSHYNDYYMFNGVNFVYPYGHGVPSYLAYFKAEKHQKSYLALLRVNVISGKAVHEMNWGFEDYETIAKQFLDTGFVRDKIEEMSCQCVKTFFLVSCGGDYTVIDCLNIPVWVFWQAYLEDGQEVFFYYATGEWRLLKASDQRKMFFDNQKDATIIR